MAEVKACASAYPFSGGIKLILYKAFEKAEDDKLLDDYLKAKYDYTHLIIVHSGAIRSFEKGYLKELRAKGFAFEAAKPWGTDLQDWIMKKVRQNNKNISKEGVLMLIELCGEDRYMIEMQLEKIFLYPGTGQAITPQIITELAASTKQYQLYEIHSAVALKDGTKMLQIGMNMLEHGDSLIGMIASLNKFFMNLFRMGELLAAGKNDTEIQKELGVTNNAMKNYKEARKRYSDADLMRIAAALLDAEIKLKSVTGTREIDVFTVLTGVITGDTKFIPEEDYHSWSQPN